MKKLIEEITDLDAVRLIKGSLKAEPEKRVLNWQCQSCFSYNLPEWQFCFVCKKEQKGNCKTIFEVV